MRRQWIIAALLLPLLGLSTSALWQGWRLAGASEWRIPVTGYDPRDLLAGHYAQYRFAWQVEGRPQLCRGGGCVLCLERRGDVVIASAAPRDEHCPNRVDPASSRISLVWPGEFSENGLVAAGRIYIPEHDAARITEVLASGDAVLVARLGRNGRLVAERIEPASR